MTNTINVPRELLERAATSIEQRMCIQCEGVPCCMPESLNALSDIRALLSAPSPAGVDGLEVVGYLLTKGNQLSRMPAGSADEPLCRLSEATAIIDGLRGEVAELQSMITNLSRAGIRMRAERDNQARRAGELEAALEFACKSLAQVTSSDGSGHADIAVSVLRMAGRKEADASQIVEAYKAGAKWRIDSALSAGKEGE